MNQSDNHRISRLPDHLPGSDDVTHHHAASRPKKTEKKSTAAPQGQHPDGIRKRPRSGREVRPSNRLQEFILGAPREEREDGLTVTTAQGQDQGQTTRPSSLWQSFERVFDFRLGSRYDVAVALRKGSPREMILVRKVTIAQTEDKEHAQMLLDLVCKFEHQNIVRFVEPYGFSISANSYFAVTEFCEGSIADFSNCTAWPWECHIATIMKQINDGVEFLAQKRLYVRPQDLENAWVTLDGSVKIAGHEEWAYTPVFDDAHRAQYLEALGNVAIELMSKSKVRANEDSEKVLDKCEKAYPNGVELVRRMRMTPFLKIGGMDQIYQYPHSHPSELASGQHMLRNQAFFKQAEKGKKELRWLVLFSNMTAWKPWAYGRKEDT